MIIVTGVKLKDAPGEVGAGFPQFIAQHNCAALIVLTPQSGFFFLQHFIADIPFSALPETSGVPASTPEASVISRNSDVRHFFIFNLTILNNSKPCQELYPSGRRFYSLRLYLFKRANTVFLVQH